MARSSQDKASWLRARSRERRNQVSASSAPSRASSSPLMRSSSGRHQNDFGLFRVTECRIDFDPRFLDPASDTKHGGQFALKERVEQGYARSRDRCRPMRSSRSASASSPRAAIRPPFEQRPNAV